MSGHVRAASPRIALIGGTEPALHHAVQAGIRIAFVHREDYAVPEWAATAANVELFPVDYTEIEVLVALLEREHAQDPFIAVLSLTEDGLEPAALVSERLELPGTPAETVRLLRHKDLMRARLADAGLSPVEYAVVDSLAALEAASAEFARPVIVKPVDGAGSAAVTIVAEPGEAATAWAAIVATGHDRAMVEELLEGREVSVESFSSEGQHLVVAITDKLVGPKSIELGHSVPAIVPDEAEIVAVVTAFLDAMGLADGPAHTEVMLTDRGPRVIEGHNRVGGDRIRVLVDHVYGLDLTQLAVLVPCGLVDAPRARPEPRGGCAVRYVTATPGRVDAVNLPDQTEVDGFAVSLGVDVSVGGTVNHLRSSYDRVAWVLADGRDAADAAERADRLAERVQVSTSPIPSRGILINSRKTLPEDFLSHPLLTDLVIITEPPYAGNFGDRDVRLVDDINDVLAVRRIVADIFAEMGEMPVLAPSEHAVLTAGYLRSYFGLPGLGFDTANRFANKLAMKLALRAAGLPVTSFARLDRLDDIAEFGKTHGWPVIVKPSFGGGAVNVVRIDSPEDAAALRDSDAGRALLATGVPLLAERYVNVEIEYEIDAVVEHGRTVFSMVSEYLKPLLGGGLCAAVEVEDPDLLKRFEELHQRVVEAMGLDAGVTHLEVFGVGSELVVGEIACRPGGAAVVPSIRSARGVDLWGALIETSLNRPVTLEQHVRKGIHGWGVLPVNRGTIVSMTEPDMLRALPGVVDVSMTHQVGDTVSYRMFSAAGSGEFLIEGDDAPEAWTRLRDVFKTFTIEVRDLE